MRYRLVGATHWETGQTENISRSGVLFRRQHSGPLFRSDVGAQPRQPLELVLELPSADKTTPGSRIRCLGEVVRTSEPDAPDMLPTVAAVVQHYHLAAN